MKRTILALAVLVAAALPSTAALTSGQILNKVKAAEASLKDMRAEMYITEANKSNVSKMGDGYGDILMLQKATIYYKKPDLLRADGYAKNIKATYIQNGYKKLVIAAMVRQVDDVKSAPGKRSDSLDLGFVSSWLWSDNTVTVLSTNKNGVAKLKFDPKHGGNDKRHDLVWLDTGTLKLISRQKYRGSGELRTRYVYSDFANFGGKLPIATKATMYNGKGALLGTVNYRNVKLNTGLSNTLFSLSTR